MSENPKRVAVVAGGAIIAAAALPAPTPAYVEIGQLKPRYPRATPPSPPPALKPQTRYRKDGTKFTTFATRPAKTVRRIHPFRAPTGNEQKYPQAVPGSRAAKRRGGQ